MEILKIRNHPEIIKQASHWFNQKWGVPIESYYESMKSSIEYPEDVTQWYVIMNQGTIIAGAGVIENDFHNRKDLSPNLCALYVEEKYRSQGVAGQLLSEITKDMANLEVTTLYLITDHKTFYELYGWVYYGEVEEEETGEPVRMYRVDYK
ncbi:GNAT family N-acetyltransferase [Vagococcus bubulae]|uniref:GNAT family N-acetyltransferase n=1 Tax=Vagococcus bubulae TaxID=1977868 RepID=A0A429ZK66_9ENTE|nr:GNAT family N-acetyltransferase [Vagococcus bubulae]RST94056.1 GNAT family N-acetyltransferase [Vagococcus bubulae]